MAVAQWYTSSKLLNRPWRFSAIHWQEPAAAVHTSGLVL